jgi:DNA-binding LacI/PurR family transcriptional regulator
VLAQPVRRMAEVAMRLLLARINGRRRRPRHEVFPFELRVRGSCGTRVSPASHLRPADGFGDVTKERN